MDNPNPEPPAPTAGGFDGSGGGEEPAPEGGDLDGLEDAPADDSGMPAEFGNKEFDAGVEADMESEPTKYIQQLSGKLGQSIRDYTEQQGHADLELEKFAINSVVSATHTSEMSPEDRNDIIKKINDAGTQGDAEIDDYGDTTSGGPEESPEGGEQEDEPTEENVIHESGIEILPKDHKQVFADAKLGVDETENKKLEDGLPIGESLGIFAESKLKKVIMQRIQQIAENDAPTKEPVTVPVVKPDQQPTRRQKPWRISPNPDPEPKAKE